jgi:tetratricopeptide (TPR) repeat protein
VSKTGQGPSLDPDVLAELERERSFLLRSLDDLDAEFEAGDLDENDYEGLSDDYTRRLAGVARSIEQERNAFEQVDNKLSNKQRIITVIAVAVVAILAGVLLARASGFRSPADSATGDIRQSSSGLLSEADTLTREGRWPEAIVVYNEVLQVAPGNVEALTYRGWLTSRVGDNAGGLIDLAEAVSVDPTYPDARVFSAILFNGEERFDEAAEQLETLDSLDTPDEMLGLISASNLRASVAAGQIKERFDPGQQVDLSQITATLDDAARAGALLSQLGDFLLAQAIFDAVLNEDPQQIIALVGKGQLGRDPGLFAESPEIAANALGALDDAVELAPNEPVIRLYRADARAAQGDAEGARVDLLVVDRDSLSADLQALYDRLTEALN